ncbi:MAG: sensor domain-containing diguanylate cyclase, partial [Methylophilales bacterium 16-45-9]
MVNSELISQVKSLKLLALRFIFVALAYILTAQLGLIGPYKESIATLLWLPSGVAVGAIMRWGSVAIPAVFIATVYVEQSLGMSLITSLSIACGNTLAPVCTAYLLKKLQFNHQLITQRDIFLLISAAMLGMLISSTGGVLSLHLNVLANTHDMVRVWFIWWVGDVIGVLLALPLVLNLNKTKLLANTQKTIQLIFWLIVFACCEYLIVNLIHDLNKQFMLTAFLILPVLIWASMMFGIVGGSLVVISLCVTAVWLTAQGYGTFYSMDVGEGL